MRMRGMPVRPAPWLAGLVLMVSALVAQAASPELVIVTGGRTQRFTSEALLAHPGVVSITVPNDVSYRRAMTYKAIPLAVLVGSVPKEDALRFVAADGFAATIPSVPLLAANDDGARAYLAIEPPAAHWPALKAGAAATAGPFYLVWLAPEKSRIGPEQWPYQVARIEEIAPITTRAGRAATSRSAQAGPRRLSCAQGSSVT